MEKITSLQNAKIKNVIKLSKSKERQKQSLIVVEGERAIQEAIKSQFILQEIYYCPDLIKIKRPESFFSSNYLYTQVSREVFDKISYAENPDGFLALAEPRYVKFVDVKLGKNPLIIVLESLEKPGNLGAILRTAYAAKVDLVIINDPKTDIYNPNVIRASEGFLFNVPLVVADRKETYKYLVEKKIQILATCIKANKIYSTVNLKKAGAILLGTESTGLSKEWLKLANEQVLIPMNSGIDSLNVSVSAAILIFEAWRQRGFN